MKNEDFNGDSVVDGSAWRSFCDRLARIGERILDEDFPATPRGRTEGYRHLANQTIGWMSWALFYAETTQPAFYRQNDLVVRWGGPNVDQVTRRARLVPEGVYRIHGHMGACEDFILTLKDGDMYMDKYGILSESTANELGIRSGDEFELVIGAEQQPGRWLPLPANATMMNFREYYFDWRALPPAIITIQRLDTVGNPPPLITPERFADQLDDAATLIERSVVYWNDWVNGERARVATNALSEPHGTTGGSKKISYGFGFFDLADNEAWLIETDIPDADYYDFQLYNLAWFETLDFPNRTTSLNHTQTTPSTDGRLRIVVSHSDPGVPNWIDTMGYNQAMFTYRWIKPRTTPTATARVVPIAELRNHLPDDTPAIDAQARRDEIRRRQLHNAWRYRT